MNTFGLYTSGNKVTDKPEILFARLDVKEVLEKVAAKKARKNVQKRTRKSMEAPVVIDIEPKEEIDFEDFGKASVPGRRDYCLRRVKKSKKLLCSQVRVGSQVKADRLRY